MHERTQQAIARLLFVLCCATPCMLVTLWIIVTGTGWYQHQVASSVKKEIQEQLGLEADFDDFKHPTPNRWIFSNLRLSHPETSALISTIRTAQWVNDSDETRMLLEQPELESRQIAILWQSFHDQILCRPKKLGHPVTISVNDLTIHSGNNAVTLSEIDAWIANESFSSSASIQLQVADSLSHAPIVMQVQRDREANITSETLNPSTTVTLSTNGTPLPCSAFNDFWPTLGSMGSSATFSGNLKWKDEPDGWTVDLGGSRFDDIELDRLFENQSHRLSGSATIQLERCLISPAQKKSDITGTLYAEQGLIGKDLLQSAGKNLNLHLLETDAWSQFSGDLPYDVLAISFNINGTQLQLEGLCRNVRGYENYPAGIAMVLNGYPLAQSSEKSMESLRLLSTIAPNHSVPVPLSQQTNWLTKVLIPPSRPLPAGTTTDPRIRSARVWQGGPIVEQP